MGTWVTFPAKLEGETVALEFDFASRLGEGETISSASVACVVYSGVDSTPTSLLSGADSTSGSVVTQRVTGGEAGTIYLLSCSAVTSASQTLFLQGLLAITSGLA